MWGRSSRFAAALLVASACGGQSARHEGSRPEHEGVPPETALPELSSRLYVLNYGSNDLSGFDIDSDSGSLAPLPGSPFRDIWGSGLAASSTHAELYVGAPGVTTYSLDGASGEVKLVGDTALEETGFYVEALGVHPSGKFLYTADYGLDSVGAVSACTLDPESGLATVRGASLPTPFSPNGIVVHPSGRFVYLSSQYAYEGDLRGFAIDQSSGALSPLAGSPFDSFLAVAIVVAPSGKYLYVSDQDGYVRTYAIDTNTGVLLERETRATTGGNPFSMVVNRDGTRLFVGNWSDGTLSSYAIDASGVPREVPGSPYSTSKYPHVNAVDASNRFLFTTNQASTLETNWVRVFEIGASGALGEVSGSPFTAGSEPIAVVSVP